MVLRYLKVHRALSKGASRPCSSPNKGHRLVSFILSTGHFLFRRKQAPGCRSDSPAIAPASGANTSKVFPFFTSSKAVWFFYLRSTEVDKQ